MPRAKAIISNRWVLTLGVLVLIGVILLYGRLTSAATYTWDGGAGDGLWSSCDNWTSNTCPGSSDIARFDGTNTSNSVIDGAFAGTVAGIDINSGYTGTITQQRDITVGTSNFEQDAGTYMQGVYDITTRSISINTGTYNVGIATTSVGSSFTVGGSATFNASSSFAVIMTNVTGGTFTYPGVFPAQVYVTRSSSNGLTIASGTSFLYPVDFTGTNGLILTVNSGASIVATSTSGTVTVQSLTISGTFNASTSVKARTIFTINSTGVFNYDPTDLDIGGSYTEVSGATFDKTGKNINLTNDWGGTFTYPGVFPAQVYVTRSSSNNLTIASGTSFLYPVDFTGTGGLILTVNSGASIVATSTSGTVTVQGLTISGTFNASTSVTVGSSGFTVNSTGVFNYDQNSLSVSGSYTEQSGATFDKTGMSINLTNGWGGTFTYPGVFPAQVYVTKSSSNNLTIASGTSFLYPVDFTGTGGLYLTVNSGASIVATSTSGTVTIYSLIVSGDFYASTTVDVAGAFGGLTLNSGAVFAFQGDTLYVEQNYTDNGATFPYKTAAIIFDGGSTDSTVTCPGDMPFSSLDVAKTSGSGDFTLASGCNATSTAITSSGTLTINGTLATEGNTLTGSSLTVGSTGTLRLYGNETVTAPTLSSGSLVDYYGPSTYTSLSGGTSYSNIQFSNGTYNLAGDVTVSGNFTNSGATFNQTSGTATFTGTSNTISGSNTFANLTKSIGAAATLTFAAGSTQTVTGTLTLSGLDASNRLTLQSSSPSSQWFINPQSTRTIDYLAISDGNNINATAVNCYDVDCTDGGNNTNFDFTAPVPGESIIETRMRGGVRFMGGVRLN